MRQSYVSRQTVPMHKTFATVRTTLWLLVVRFAVPGDFRLRMEHLAAHTNVILFLGPNFQVMPIPVLYQIGVTSETFRTHFTL